jgi:hypothetical protein
MQMRHDSFYYRGRSYSCDFCPTCNSLYNCPPADFYDDVKAGVFEGTQPGDRIYSGAPIPSPPEA